MYHSKKRETPLPIYIGLSIHAKIRKRSLIDRFFDLGLSISYDRVMEIFTSMANRLCKQYHYDNIVCPLDLRQGLFTTAAINNIDHNPTSTSATDSFHGTGISRFQHPYHHNQCLDRREHRILEQSSTKKTLLELPQYYTNVHPLVTLKKEVLIPQVHSPLHTDGQVVSWALHKEAG